MNVAKCLGPTLLLVILALSCNKSTGPVNQPPSVPVIDMASGAPSNDGMSPSLTPVLRWTCADPENDPLTYDVYFGTTTNPPLVNASQTETSYSTGALQYETSYYWRVVAKDNHSNITSSQEWTFASPIQEVIPVFADPEIQISINRREKFVVSLSANPSTGYRWELISPVDDNILSFRGRSFVADSHQEGVTGYGGQYLWTFMAAGVGSAVVSIGNYPPGSTNTEKVVEFDITVE